MGKLRIITPTGQAPVDEVYREKEPPIELLQDKCGGYVEHIPVTYEGKRRSAYVVDPFARLRITPARSREMILCVNIHATRIVGQPIRGVMVIDLGKEK